MRPCEFCHGDGGWWLDRRGRRLRFGQIGLAVAWRQCTACVNGEESCCEGAVGGPDEVGNAPNTLGGE
jgi:hypothetical protein